MPDRSHQLEKCVHLLSSKSTDDEKLAGLLLVPKVVDAQDVESLEYLLCSMDSRFIERLLRTGIKQATASELPEAHSSKEEDSVVPPMLSIALFVIDVFASHSSLAQRPQILDHMVTLWSVVSLNIPHISSDAVQVLCKLLTVDPAIERLLTQPAPLAKVIEVAGHSPPNSLELTQFMDYTLSKCSLWLHSQPAPSVQLVAGWVSLMNDISLQFSQAEAMLKFELIPVLASALAPLDSKDAAIVNEMVACKAIVENIRSGCMWIMRQRSETTEYFDQALVLASHAVRLWPHDIFSMRTAADSSNSRSKQPKQKAAELILRLACIEGQAATDSMMIRAPPDQKSVQLTGVVAADADRLLLGWKLPFCAEIAASWLEWADEWLDSQDDSEDVDEASMYSLMGDVQKLAEAAVTFMIDWKERVESERAMMAASPELVASVVHLLGRWLATDTKLHNQGLPILAMCASWIDQSDQYGQAIKEYMRPSISSALETCEVDEAQYVDDLKTHRLRHKSKRTQDFASPWVGTIEFDDLARAVYGILSDEEMIRQRRAHNN